MFIVITYSCVVVVVLIGHVWSHPHDGLTEPRRNDCVDMCIVEFPVSL